MEYNHSNSDCDCQISHQCIKQKVDQTDPTQIEQHIMYIDWQAGDDLAVRASVEKFQSQAQNERR